MQLAGSQKVKAVELLGKMKSIISWVYENLRETIAMKAENIQQEGNLLTEVTTAG